MRIELTTYELRDLIEPQRVEQVVGGDVTGPSYSKVNDLSVVSSTDPTWTDLPRKRRSPKNKRSFQGALIERLYTRQGDSLARVSRAVHKSIPYVKKVLKSRGVNIRHRGGSNHKKK